MDLDLAEDLPSLLTLERLDRDLFRGRNANYGPRQTLYGGQVAAQCLLAAAATVEPERLPHSLHGYFLRARDAATFPSSSRSIGTATVARSRPATSSPLQEGDVIFSMITSFHAESEGGVFDDAPRRAAPEPEDTVRSGWNALLEVREVTPTDFLKGVFTDCVWVRSDGPARRRPAHPPGRTHLPVRPRHGIRPAGLRRSSAGAGRASTTPCGSRRTSEPTTGCSSTCGR